MTTSNDAHDEAANQRRAACLAATAAAALLLGLLVYLADRSGRGAALIPRVDALAGWRVFGAFAQWLPSFVHPFAFSLLTAVALPARAAPRYGVCVAWGLVNIAFEIGQHVAIRGPLAVAVVDALGPSLPARRLADYFLHGTFDGGDLVAAILGAAAAAGVLARVQPRREQNHAA